ncbi:MAG TPA: nucleoside triphosphate pyrophosphohydrolase [Streptomyces sp.]|nr:nucleoside triphosphate pyrophosphohydrolase [Streptomyces sp.]
MPHPEKLVRDQVPTTPHAGWTFKQVQPSAVPALLTAKLTEETVELRRALAAGNRRDIADEAADVLEVLTALTGRHGVAWEDVQAAAKAKRESRGGFNEGWVGICETPAENEAEHCAHCGRAISRVTGTLAAWWVHNPGGNTICDPQQAANSPRATPPAAGRQDRAPA